uniref:Uncharacterized protein n=1 Tax=Parascaris univalens TaxID=6257 RepID=A0A915A0Y6_PARUN
MSFIGTSWYTIDKRLNSILSIFRCNFRLKLFRHLLPTTFANLVYAFITLCVVLYLKYLVGIFYQSRLILLFLYKRIMWRLTHAVLLSTRWLMLVQGVLKCELLSNS